MRTEFKGGRLYLHRTEQERKPLEKRLKRIEGQVRGLQKMIQEDRYCGDELQQASAVLAAMRGVMLLLIDQHMSAAVSGAVAGDLDREDALRDIDQLLRMSRRGL
jgi:DNA-binding FrmR family transcriptional regulator